MESGLRIHGGHLVEIFSVPGEYTRIGELYGFPILVKTESSIREGVEVKQNRFFIEGEYKYTYNNGQIVMADHKVAVTNFLNALDRIPKLMHKTTIRIINHTHWANTNGWNRRAAFTAKRRMLPPVGGCSPPPSNTN